MGGTRVKKSAKRFAKQLPAVIKGRKRRQQVLRNKEKRESRREASVREESFRDAQQETEKEGVWVHVSLHTCVHVLECEFVCVRECAPAHVCVCTVLRMWGLCCVLCVV